MPEIRFNLSLSVHEFLAYYEGVARDVIVTGKDGRRLRFPAHVLRPYVTHDGVRGEFILEFDDNHRFQRIRKV